MPARPRRSRISATKPEQKLGVAYARFSLQKQASIPEQHGINQEIAAEHGVRLVGPAFDDPAVSRSVADRKGLKAMFDYLESHGEVRYIVVNELERLTAGVDQRHEIVQLCKRLGITILTEDIGAIDPFDDDKMHEADQRAVAGQGEVLKIRRRVRRNLRQKVLAGTVVMRPAFGTRMKPLVGPDGHALPAGTKLIDAQGKKISSGELEVEETEHPWLQKMFEWADEGCSDDEIARRLTRARVPTKSGQSTWKGNSVGGILTNRLYVGELTWGRTKTVRDAEGKSRLVERDADDPGRVTLESPLGALVDPVLFERVQSQRADRVGRRGTRRTYGTQLFDDFVYCARCGHKMYGRNDASGKGNEHRDVVIWRYWCNSNRYNKGYGPPPGFRVCERTHSMPEKKILAALAASSTPNVPALVTVRAAAPEDREAQRRLLTQEIASLRTEHQRAVDLAVRGLLTEDELATAKAVREEAIAAATARLSALDAVAEPEPFEFTAENRNLFAELVELLRDVAIPMDDRRDALRAFGLKRLYVDNPRVQMEIVG